MRIEEASAEELLGRLNEVERKNAPKQLFFAGDRSILRTGARISIVGSRKASAGGRTLSRSIAEIAASRGAVVVSGLAEGIDTEAHEAAMAVGGRTMAVLGTSLDEAFPTKNRALQGRIMRDHLAVTQFGTGVPLRPGNFPMRNRTMALFSDATVIVEAGEKSGSLHQGWEALRLGRPLFLTEGSVFDASLSWPAEFMNYGAVMLPSNRIELLFEFVPERSGAEASTPSF